MADRKLFQDLTDFHPGVAYINLQFTAGTSGAVPARGTAGTRMAGIASVALSGTGLYTVTFQDTWFAILGVYSGVYQATYNVAHCGQFTSTPAGTTTSSIALQGRTMDGVGTAAALTAGDVMWAIFKVAKSQGTG